MSKSSRSNSPTKRPFPSPGTPTRSTEADGFRRVAQIVGVFGLKGHVKIRPMTDFWERFEPGQIVRLDGRDVEIHDAQSHKGGLILKLDGVDGPEEARAVQFHYLEAPTDFEPELEEDEYITEDLIGLHVYTVEGEPIGVVANVLATPAHDVIVVGEIMIPAVKQFVKDVDLDSGRMTVELIEGMRPEDAQE